jgi:hypothetical protein
VGLRQLRAGGQKDRANSSMPIARGSYTRTSTLPVRTAETVQARQFAGPIINRLSCFTTALPAGHDPM